MNEITNADLYGVLMDIREDIGALKATTGSQLKEVAEHAERIGALELSAAKQRGAIGVWGVIATGAAAISGAAVQLFRGH